MKMSFTRQNVNGFTVSELNVIVRIARWREIQGYALQYDYEFQFKYAADGVARGWVGGFKCTELRSNFIDESRPIFIMEANSSTITCFRA